MIWEDLDERLVLVNQSLSSQDEVFEKLGSCFIEAGYCKESYVDALKERERFYPTGLSINGFGIAIPHTDDSHVNREVEGVLTLAEPVSFVQMGSDDIEVQVKVVMMLAIKNPQDHMTKLQRILKIVQDEKLMEKVHQAKTKSDIIQMIKEKEKQLDAGKD